MADHFGFDLGQLLTRCSQRPFLHRLRQCQTPQGIVEVAGQSEQLKTDLIIHKIMAIKLRPVQGVLTFLDPLLGRVSLVIELYDIARFPPEVRDYEVAP